MDLSNNTTKISLRGKDKKIYGPFGLSEEAFLLKSGKRLPPNNLKKDNLANLIFYIQYLRTKQLKQLLTISLFYDEKNIIFWHIYF